MVKWKRLLTWGWWWQLYISGWFDDCLIKSVTFKALCLTAVTFISLMWLLYPDHTPRKHRLDLSEFSPIRFWTDENKVNRLLQFPSRHVNSASCSLLLKSDLLKHHLYMSPLRLKIVAPTLELECISAFPQVLFWRSNGCSWCTLSRHPGVMTWLTSHWKHTSGYSINSFFGPVGLMLNTPLPSGPVCGLR